MLSPWLRVCSVYSHPSLQAPNAVFISLPAVKHVARATPGGVAWLDKREAAGRRSAVRATSHPSLLFSSVTHFTAEKYVSSSAPPTPRSFHRAAARYLVMHLIYVTLSDGLCSLRFVFIYLNRIYMQTVSQQTFCNRRQTLKS